MFRIAFALAWLLPALALAETPGIWNQWRGPQRDGSIGGPAWPEKLSGEAVKQLWRVELGSSYSTPIVTVDKVFVTETVDRTRESVRALNRQTGEQIWQVDWEGSLQVPFFAAANGSWIRATPAWDGENLYVAGIRDVVVSLNGETGKENWRVDFVKLLNTPLPAFGFVASPLVVGEHLYVQAGAAVIKLEKATGHIVWQTLKDGGGMYGSAFSSPVFARVNGSELLIAQTRDKLAGVDPDTGEVLWSQEIPATQRMNILTPTLIPGREPTEIFTSTHGGASFLYAVQDGKLVEKWKHKAQGYMSSPVVIDGHIYMHLKNQRFTCLDAATGEEKWTTTPYGKYWSLVMQGDRILALDERGDLLLIRANPEKFDLIDQKHISDQPTWAHLVVLDGQIFIRELNAMTVYSWTAAE